MSAGEGGVVVQVDDEHAHPVALGDVVQGEGERRALVVALCDGFVELLPLRGAWIRGSKSARAEPLALAGGGGSLGRILDALGRPLDGAPPPAGPRIRVFPGGPRPRLDGGSRWTTGLLVFDLTRRFGREALVLHGGAPEAREATARLVAAHHRAQGGVVVWARLDPARLDPPDDATTLVTPGPDACPAMASLTPWTAAALARSLRDEGREVLLIVDEPATPDPAAWSRWRGETPATRLERLADVAGATDDGSVTLLLLWDELASIPEPVHDAFVLLDAARAQRGAPAMRPTRLLHAPVKVADAGTVLSGIAVCLHAAEDMDRWGGPDPTPLDERTQRGRALRVILAIDDGLAPEPIEQLCGLIAVMGLPAAHLDDVPRLRAALFEALRGEQAPLVAAIRARRRVLVEHRHALVQLARSLLEAR